MLSKSHIKKRIYHIRKIYYKEKPLKIEWIALCILSFVMLISFCYMDTISLTVWSVNFLDVVAEGKVWDYYLYCYQNEYGAISPAFAGPYFVIIPWAIWNIPIWLIQKYMGIMIVSNGWMMVWSKLFLVIVELIVLLFTYKITILLTNSREKALWANFLSASFPFVLINVYYTGQSDIIVLAYGVISVYQLLRHNKKWFLLFSALAIISKPFWIFPFIILVLYTEKHIFKIFFQFLIGFSFMLVFSVVYAYAPMFRESYGMTYAKNNMDMLTRVSFGHAVKADASWFFLLFVVLCVIAYVKKSEDSVLRGKYIIYFTTAANLLVVGFTSIQHYRPIYLFPFLFILFMTNMQWYRVNIILKTFYSTTTMFAMLCGSSNIFSKRSMQGTLITKVFPLAPESYGTIQDMVIKRIADYETYHKIFASVSVACVVLMLIINYPLIKVKPEIECTRCERWIYWMDLGVMAGVILVVFKIFMGWFSFI